MATQCANCSAAALYVYEVTADFSQFFCSAHLPGFLRTKGAPVGLVQKTEEHAQAVARAGQKLAAKRTTKASPKKSLMADAPPVEVGDTGLSDDDESEVVLPNGPED